MAEEKTTPWVALWDFTRENGEQVKAGNDLSLSEDEALDLRNRRLIQSKEKFDRIENLNREAEKTRRKSDRLAEVKAANKKKEPVK